MLNNMQITAKWSISKPDVDFQYGGRLFFKFGLLMDFDLLKANKYQPNNINKYEAGSSIERPRPPS